MAITYSDVAGLGGKKNQGGLKQFFYWAPKDTFASIAAVPAAPTTFDQLVEIATDHTFNTGGKFYKIYCTMDKGEFEAPAAGEHDGLVWAPTAKVFIPGDDPVNLGLVSQMMRDYGIFLFPGITEQMASRFYQIGIEDMWGYAKPSFNAGKNRDGLKGTEIEITSNQPDPIIYSGAIQLTPAP